jgi:EAL domain-containing protein (putative c-di-GMP-specific phosphodiesterase class I)
MSALTKAVTYAVSLCRATRLKRQVLEESGALQQQITDRAGLTVKFESALRNLWMAYQPIVRWSTRSIFAYEALVRSREPAIPHPGALFDAAEKLDRVRDVGRVIRELTPAPFSRAPDESLLFVNLHTQDLDDPLLHAEDSPLAAYASRTVVEITERASLDQIKDVRSRIDSLRRLGFRIALDDIGAGYAGLSSFAAIEPDVVKIDMSLVRDVHRSPTKQRLVSALTTLCENLGKVVIAEGVETADELWTLRDLGCDYFQGYYFARPEAPFASVNWAEKSAA